MTALFVVERNKAQLLVELFKLLKLSAEASRHFSLARGSRGGAGRGSQQNLNSQLQVCCAVLCCSLQHVLQGNMQASSIDIPVHAAVLLQSQGSEDRDNPETTLMKKRVGEGHMDRRSDSREPRLATLLQMHSDAASSGGMSDDDGMSNFETPSGSQESKLRYCGMSGCATTYIKRLCTHDGQGVASRCFAGLTTTLWHAVDLHTGQTISVQCVLTMSSVSKGGHSAYWRRETYIRLLVGSMYGIVTTG